MVLIKFQLDFHARLLLYFLTADSKEREIINCLPIYFSHLKLCAFVVDARGVIRDEVKSSSFQLISHEFGLKSVILLIFQYLNTTSLYNSDLNN